MNQVISVDNLAHTGSALTVLASKTGCDDTSFPYGPEVATSAVWASQDAPAQQIVNTFTSVSVHYSFTDYFMYQPATPNAIWVTLGTATWGWSALGANHPSGWTISNKAAPNSQPVASSVLGTWACGFANQRRNHRYESRPR